MKIINKKWFYLFLVFIPICLILTIYQLLGGRETWVFKVFTWERGISRFFDPKLTLISAGTGYGSNNEIDGYYEDYYFYNFSNSSKDFSLINSFLENKQTLLLQNFEKEKKLNYVYSFKWNNIFDSSRRLLSEPDTQTGVLNVGLFTLKVNHYPEGYYFLNVHEWGRLNNNGVCYKFNQTGSNKIETNADNFNFIFWVQAEDFLDKEISKKEGKKISFYNKKNKIVEFDYLSLKGYKLRIKNLEN